MTPRKIGRVWWRVEFKRQDLWIGAFWKHTHDDLFTDLWVCIVPMVPLHVWWAKEAG